MLLWLWRRLVAIVPIRPLAWEPPYASGVALEKTKKKPPKTSPHAPLVKCMFISGTVNLGGRCHRVLPGGVGLPGPCPEGLVQGRDAGDLQEPALPG